MGKSTSNFNAFASISVLCCFIATTYGGNLQTFVGEYGPFNETYYDIFEVVYPAMINNDALQLTPNSWMSGMEFPLQFNSARILLKRPFKLWQDDNSSASNLSQPQVASFNSSFLINVYPLENQTPSEGLAFVIAPDLLVPPNSYGQFLGLTNSLTDGARNNMVAVEFDNIKQYFDPDDNHVGIDVNSVKSIKTEYLTPYNITIAPVGVVKFYNVWVDYDGIDTMITVYISEQGKKSDPTPPKPVSPILSTTLDLRSYVNQHSYFGFSASTGNSSQLNCVLRWNLTVYHFPDSKGRHYQSMNILLRVGVPLLALLLIGAAGLGFYLQKQWKNFTINLVGTLKNLPGMPREFKFRDLKKATNNFDEKNKLGQGGFGVVYRGILVKENLEIAVKWFSRESNKGQDDFLAELTIINRLRHKHLVKLLGWCHKHGKLLLVYEYMPNGSLDRHLFIGQNIRPLEWNLRYKIISGVASALHYLHNEYEQKVVHRDIKASNIMLDFDFNARLGDFGLARALENEKTSYAEAEGVLGTVGYIAPECFLTGKATRQSDVYAFGAVLLEVVCGLRPGTKIAGFQFLVDWAWFLRRDGRLLEAVDKKLGDDYIAEEAERLLLLGLACSHPTASERPKTQAILQILSGSMQVPIVPPFKPAFVWPAAEQIDYMDPSSVNTTSIISSHFISDWRTQDQVRESNARETSSV